MKRTIKIDIECEQDTCGECQEAKRRDEVKNGK